MLSADPKHKSSESSGDLYGIERAWGNKCFREIDVDITKLRIVISNLSADRDHLYELGRIAGLRDDF